MKATVSDFAREQLGRLNPQGYRSLIEDFERAVADYSDRRAFVCGGHELGFPELDRASRALAAYLRGPCGLEPGDRVAIQLPSITQYPIAVWAALRADLIVVNTNPLYTPRELIHQFTDSGAKALIVLGGLLEMIGEVVKEAPIRTIISCELAANAPSGAAPDCGDATLTTFAGAIAGGADLSLPPAKSTLDDIAVLQYTSGTTGVAKGVMLTQGNLLAGKRMGDETFGNDPAEIDIAISPMPLYHIYGFAVHVISGVLKGSLSVLVPDPRNTDNLVDVMRRFPFTVFTGINTLFSSLMLHPDFDSIDFSNARKVISGGTTLIEEVAREWQERTDSVIYEGYGLSETSAGGSVNTPQRRQLGSVGIPLKYSEMRVVDEHGAVLGQGQRGELQLRGPHVMAGYWQRPEATADVLDDAGWLSTGDVAVMQDDGFVRIVDRLKDMIIVSGFNVYPTEVESVVYALDDIRECAVVGVPDAHSGEAVKLFVASANPKLTEQDIRQHCQEQLAAYKVPKLIEFRDELPKTPVGKVLRRELRESATT